MVNLNTKNNFGFNVFGYEDKKIFLLRIARHNVNLLYISLLVKNIITYQWNAAADLRQYHYGNSKRYFFQYCLHGCTSEEVLKTHVERFKLHGLQRIKLLEAGDKKGRNKFKFTKTEHWVNLRFGCWPDFKQYSCESLSLTSFTTQYQHHIRSGSWNYVKYGDRQYFEPPQVHMANQAAETFLGQILAAAGICRQHLANKTPIKRLNLQSAS